MIVDSNATKTIPNLPTRMVSIALMIMPHKEFGDMVIELKREKIDMVSHARLQSTQEPRKREECVGVYCQACSGIPLAVRFVGRDRLLWNSMVQGTQKFRQVRAASLRNTLDLVWFVLP